ncbi:MAG TPA: amidohydrolase family protein [Candidatus Didemnitutus sp.]
MDRIDAHVHLYPPGVNADPGVWGSAHREDHWATLCTRVRADGSLVQGFPSVDGLLREMDGAGIARSVLLGWYWNHPDNAADQNRFFLECIRAHPDRLSAFAALNPRDGARAQAEIRWAKENGFAGLGELSPHSISHPVDAPEWTEIFALAGELRLPVNLHTADPLARSYRGAIATPRSWFIETAHRHPETNFVLAHWGGGLAFEPSARDLKNVWFDSAASPLMYKPDAWNRAVAGVGPDRLIFGSDFPLRLYPRGDTGSGMPAFVREAAAMLAMPDQAAVFSGNVRRLLAL